MNDKKKKFENIYEQISFPKDWDPTSLSDVFDLRRETMVPTGIGNQRYIGLEHIDSGRMKISRYGVESEIRSAKNKFYPDDILYGKLRPYLDKSVLADIEGICSTDILVFKVDKERILPRYGACLVHTSAFLQYVISTTTGVNHPRTSWSSIGKFRCSIPKLAEQSIIVHALFILQQAIEHQEKIIEKTKELKRSLMQRLFTYGLRGEELKETEIGLMPRSWDVVRLGDENVLEMVQYGISVRGESSGKYPILRMNSIVGGYVVAEKLQYVDITRELFEKFSLEKGDILFNRTNSIDLVGKTGIFNLTGKYTFASYLIRLRTNKKKLTSEFLNLYLNLESSQERLKTLATRGVSQSNISGSRLKTLCIPLPPDLDEQKEIAHILSSVDKKLSQAEARKQTLQSLFKSMLQLLMTGQVRVKDIDFGVDCE